MVQIVGLMIGMYILLRCLSFYSRAGELRERDIVRVFALITAVTTLFLMVFLVLRDPGDGGSLIP